MEILNQTHQPLLPHLLTTPRHPVVMATSSLSSKDKLLGSCKQALKDQPPLLKRPLVSVAGAEGGGRQGNVFRVMQWNILAQALSQADDSFVRCPPAALNWDVRKFRILEEILAYGADVLCFQEVDHYHDFLEPALKSLGYHGLFYPKPDSPTLYCPNNNGPDGCALFFRKEKFLLVDADGIVLSSRGCETNQVALFAKLQFSDPSTGGAKPFVIGVTHLKARKGWERLRSEQGKDLLKQTQKFSGKGTPVVLCGDFNAQPAEDVYSVLSKSKMKLNSAYKSLSADGTSEPEYTTWTVRTDGEWRQTLDYIWYSQDKFQVETLVDIPTEELVGETRFPSHTYPSDHLSLVCDFKQV
ncbi:Nocturnin [Branchiostoma belcheri]|nr:Nocturnin [Branchiostoma belcheri]